METFERRWAQSIKVEPFIILDNSQVAMPSAPAELFVVHRQKTQADKIRTWIGLYRAVPNRATNRKGDYCGVGLWLLKQDDRRVRRHPNFRDLMKGTSRSIQVGGEAILGRHESPVGGWRGTSILSWATSMAARNSVENRFASTLRAATRPKSMKRSTISRGIRTVASIVSAGFSSLGTAPFGGHRSRGRIPIKRLADSPDSSRPQPQVSPRTGRRAAPSPTAEQTAPNTQVA